MEYLNQLLCSTHNNNEISYIYLNQASPTTLVCDECVIDNNLNKPELVLIDSIFDKDKDSIIPNWPPNINMNLLNKIIEINKQDNRKSQFQNQIESYFKELQKELLDCLKDIMKRSLIESEEYDFQQEQLKDIYSQIAQQEQLQNLINKYKGDKDELHANLVQYISKMKKQSKVSNKKLEKLYNNHREKVNQMSFVFPELIKKTTLHLLSNIKFNMTINKEDQQQQNNDQLEINQQEEIRNQQDLKEELSYLSSLLESLSYKIQQQLNEKTEKFEAFNDKMSQICRGLTSYQYEIDQLNTVGNAKNLNKINNKLQDCNKISYYQYLNREDSFIIQYQKLKRILRVSSQMIGLNNNQIDSLSKLVTEMGNKTYSQKEYLIPKIINLIKSDKFYSKDEIQKVQNIFTEYPILDLALTNKITPAKYKFYISNEIQKNLITITSLQNNQTKIQFQNGQPVSVQSNLLDNNKKYIVILQFTNYCLSQINEKIGLKETQQNQQQDQFYFLGQNKQQGIGLLKGQTLYNQKSLEMRICINENKLEFYDYPNYQNSQYRDSEGQNRFDQNSKYYIFFESYNEYITIQNIYEVDQFPNI